MVNIASRCPCSQMMPSLFSTALENESYFLADVRQDAVKLTHLLNYFQEPFSQK